MSQNSWKWIIAFAIGALGGLVNVAMDSTAMFPGWWEITRHMLIGMGTVVAPLKMTLFPAKD